MFITTHRCIGKLIYNYLKDYHHIKLDQRAFKYGCMKPDLPLNKIQLPHYKTDSFIAICEMINKLSPSSDTFRDKRSLAEFSENLGVILHYIADFFCEAHNFHSYKRITHHLHYERNLSVMFEEFKTTDLKNMINKFKNNYIASPKSSLRQYINDRHIEYLNTERTFYTDLNFSLSVCVNVAQAIISPCAAASDHYLVTNSDGVA